MKIGFIGLGRMGNNMVLNLLENNHKIVVNNRSPEPIKKLAKKGAIPAFNLKELFENLPKQKIIWLMIPAGKPVDDILKKITPFMKKGDIIIDGGNSFFKDSIKRYKKFKKNKIGYLDCGTSGGMEGARHGACMMIGGDKNVFEKVKILFKDMTVKNGYGYMGKAGSGHFVKGIHNAIEYGMMGALNEGFEAIKKQKKYFGTDLKEVSKVYDNGSIIEGRLSHWLFDAMGKPNYFNSISCQVPKGETENEMEFLEKMSYMPILHQARLMRVNSRKNKFCGRVISALRNEFGGHKVIKKNK